MFSGEGMFEMVGQLRELPGITRDNVGHASRQYLNGFCAHEGAKLFLNVSLSAHLPGFLEAHDATSGSRVAGCVRTNRRRSSGPSAMSTT
jgi:hypothetical protein